MARPGKLVVGNPLENHAQFTEGTGRVDIAYEDLPADHLCQPQTLEVRREMALAGMNQTPKVQVRQRQQQVPSNRPAYHVL